MLLTRKYHFYAAHRNQVLKDKCRGLHGHCYKIRVTFDLEYNPESSITILFADVDALVKPYLDQYDHSTLIDINDPLCKHLLNFEDVSYFKFVVFEKPTSVENLAIKLFREIGEKTGLNVFSVEVDETESSTITFTSWDNLALLEGVRLKNEVVKSPSVSIHSVD